MAEAQQATMECLRREVLAQAVEEALYECDQQPSSLRSAMDVTMALQALRRCAPIVSNSPEQQQEPALCASSSLDWLAGSATGSLGAQQEQLEAQLPTPANAQAAVQQLLPHVEGRLAERCRQLAAAAGYDSE